MMGGERSAFKDCVYGVLFMCVYFVTVHIALNTINLPSLLYNITNLTN